MTRRISALIGGAALGLAAMAPQAWAQTPPPPAQTVELFPQDPGSAVVEELQVVARPPGPALWLVEKGGAKLYVVGSAPPLPHQLKWDSPRLNRAMDQASLVLVPPEASVGPLQVTKFFLTGGGGVRYRPFQQEPGGSPPARPEGAVRQRPRARRTHRRAVQGLEAGGGRLHPAVGLPPGGGPVGGQAGQHHRAHGQGQGRQGQGDEPVPPRPHPRQRRQAVGRGQSGLPE
jgi:hypothetical protein